MKTVVRGALGASLAAVGLGSGGSLVDMHSALIGFSCELGIATVAGVEVAVTALGFGEAWAAVD